MTLAPGPEAGDLAAPLDFLLTSAAVGPWKRFLPDASWSRFAQDVAARPASLRRRLLGLGGELAGIAIGNSDRAPSRRDRRFADPAWSQNPLLRRVLQAYLAAAETAHAVVAESEVDWKDHERVSFVIDNVVEALAPSNVPFLSPDAWKAVIDTGGANVLRGLRSLVADLAQAPRVPSMIDPDAYTVGKDLATTEGAVVYRDDVFELIQYRPRTDQVHSVPLLLVPPVINKFYVADLAPGRSLIEYLLDQGQQMFVISWRNPDARHRAWGADTYGAAIVAAMDATQRVAAADSVQILATCSGGMLAAMTLGHLANTGALDRVAGLCLAVTIIDNSRAGLVSAMTDEKVAASAVARSGAKGYLDGRTMAEVFAWLRPTDLIWNYWVNNYLLGRRPPKFDVLYWNADTTRMAAAMHRDFVNLAMTNALTRPGEATMLGSPVDLGKITTPAYVVAGISDHICPWQACYRTTQLLGGETRFVLSTSGHIASIVNPPTNPKAAFQTSDANPPDPDQWLRGARNESSSWWPDYAGWLGERGGPLKDAPAQLGGAGLPPLEPAPGTYVFDS